MAALHHRVHRHKTTRYVDLLQPPVPHTLLTPHPPPLQKDFIFKNLSLGDLDEELKDPEDPFAGLALEDIEALTAKMKLEAKHAARQKRRDEKRQRQDAKAASRELKAAAKRSVKYL